MLIDWSTVGFQIINFLILVLLLRRFLYRPIMNAMAERERKIAARLEQAEKQRAVAAAEIETYQQKNADFAQEREQLIRQAQAEAADRRRVWLEEARAEVDETRTRWHRALAEEKEAFLQTVRKQAGQQTYTFMRRALADLADAELETRIVQVFLARLTALPEEEARAIRQALQEDSAVLTLKSAFEIDKSQWQSLRQAIFALFGVGQPIKVQTTPDLICGLELVAPGHKVAWSLASYLDGLEETLMEVLEEVGAEAADTAEVADTADTAVALEEQTHGQ